MVHITNLSVSGSVSDSKYLIDAELGDLNIIDSRETSKHKKCVYYVILHHFLWGMPMYTLRGVGNNLKFCRSLLNLFLKDKMHVWPEHLIISLIF